jgi:hypothetical protein
MVKLLLFTLGLFSIPKFIICAGEQNQMLVSFFNDADTDDDGFLTKD